MKSTFKNPQYILRKSGKGVHKMKIDFFVDERHINYAIFQLGEYEKIADLTHQDIQKKVTQNFYDFGEFGMGNDYRLDKREIYIANSTLKNYGVRIPKDTDVYEAENENKEKVIKKIVALGKRLFPAYYTNQKTKKNQ